MINMQPITLEMKRAIEQIRVRYQHTTSSHAFPSLYIWQKDMGLSIHLEEDMFLTKCRWRGENAWFFPCGKEQRVRYIVQELLTEKNLLFCYLRKADAVFLESAFPGCFRITEYESDHEYLYDRMEQQMLHGRKFSGLRSHINRIQADHTLCWKPLGAENIEDAFEINRKWQQNCNTVQGLTDIAASEQLLQVYEGLDTQGVVIWVDGDPYAVAAGYPLSEHTFDISLAKQKSQLTGLSVYAKHAFICSLPAAYTILNAEKDLGMEGLRTMKRQMRPLGQIKFYEGKCIANEENR